VLGGLALLVADGPAAAAPTLRQAVSVFTGAGLTVEDGLRWGWMAQGAASALWDSDAWHVMLVRQLQLARDAGALERLPLLLASLGTEVVWSGDFAAGAALVAEADAVCEATGSRSFPFTAMMLASLRGNQAEAAALIEATLAEAEAAGQGIAVAYANWVAAILANSLGRYTDALAAARQAAQDTSALYISMWALPELIEAAARTGDTGIAGDALTRLAQFTQAGGTDFGLGVEARCRALLSGGEAAESLYREAIDRLGRTRLRPELARAHLLYGEWLRREHRHSDAREQLRTAHGMLEAMGAEAFAERAQRELRATGETARKRTAVAMNEELTTQEAQIARLARDGLSNPEIGARLFVSVRTVQYHLGKVFTKLDISSRSQLDRVLPGEPAASRPCQTPSRQDPRRSL
jgi:DNA-binding CsgD family transcriptional regulator